MAGKPELSAAPPGVPNVVVYVSNDNFAQAYSVGPQNAGYTGQIHPMAPLDTKTGGGGGFPHKHHQHHHQVVEHAGGGYNAAGGGYFTNQAVINQNGFPQQQQQQPVYKSVEVKDAGDERAAEYEPAGGYVVMGGDGAAARCDSVRSETAESSCSSLSSADEGVHHQQQQDVLVYENGARHVVVGGAGPPPVTIPAVANNANLANSAQTFISVPHGWKRLSTNGVVIYISPSNAVLSSPDQVKEYLLTTGTCKCGLECPLKYDSVFNFDPKVIGKAWTLSPDTNTGDLTKLCNHKRKIIAMASLGCKPPDPNKIPKDYMKRKKRNQCGPYPPGVSVSQMMAGQREKQPVPQPYMKENVAGSPQQQYPPMQMAAPTQHHQGQQLQQQPPPPSLHPHQQQVELQQQQQHQGPNQFFRYQEQHHRMGSPVVLGDGSVVMNPNQNISQHVQMPQQPQQQILGPNGQVINVGNQMGVVNNGMLIQGGQQQQQQRVFVNGQPSEPSGPGRPVQMIPVSISTNRPEMNHRIPQQQFYQNYAGQFEPGKLRPFTPSNQNPTVGNGFRQNAPLVQKMWNPRVPLPSTQSPQSNNANMYERVPPLHQHQPPPAVWQDEINRKKFKPAKLKKRAFNVLDRTGDGHSPCPNIDVRQIPNESARNVLINNGQFPPEQQNTSSPSFLEDPSGYLAQQTALLNSTINRQTGVNNGSGYVCNSPVAPPPQNQVMNTSQPNGVPLPSNIQIKQPYGARPPAKTQPQYNQQQVVVGATQGTPDSSAMNEMNCQGCTIEYQQAEKFPQRSSSTPSAGEDPVTSSNYVEKPDSRPIQGGTVSTSNNVEAAGSPPEAAATPPVQDVHVPFGYQTEPNQNVATHFQIQQLNQNAYHGVQRGIVTTMASGRTVGCNTITSVLAGRANTATVSINNPAQLIAQQASKSPLEMVQSVVSSIKVPQTQPQQQVIPQQVVKQQGLPQGHIFVSSGGQLIMASTNSGQVMPPPPPPKIVTNQTSMPPISVSPMITNVTGSVTQMIPAVAQQVLGQQTVLVNALPAPFVLQPGVTMTMDGMNMQIPHLVTGNVIQQQIQIDNSDPRRVTSLLSPENKKKGKKRKMSTQTVASMLHIAAQQNSGVVGFPQQIQMAHSPQGLTTAPVMQALTIVPGKAGGPHQIVMPNTQPLLNSQSQQINLLQPVNLTQSMVQNFPTIQQFVVPNLTGMVMNADGTATIVQDTNIGMQLQLQNVNGQNVLTPVQNNQMFAGGQSIIPTGMVIRPQGKILQQQHSPGAQFLSPNGGGQFVAQFNGQLSPLVANVSPGQQVTFSTGPQIRPNNTVQQPQQEYIQCGQTLMVPTNITTNNANQQNTTYVQQNTTIVQQQTTMLSNQQNNHQNQTLDQNFIIADNKQQPVQTVVLQQRQSPLQQLAPNYRHSVSTQTAVNQNGQTVTTNTFCQTTTSNAGSPPDTTTHSPMASGGQSPPTADTTTHTGSTDDGLSPAPSNCSGSCGDIVNLQATQQSSMAMVHCISSSEPDSAEIPLASSEFDWRSVSNTPKMEYTDIDWRGVPPKMEYTDITSAGGGNHLHQIKKETPTTHVAYAESSTMVHFAADGGTKLERNYEKIHHHKRKHSDALVVMETRQMHSSLFDDEDDEGVVKEAHAFVQGDLVWGPARGCPAWPGKLLEAADEDRVLVRWFGGGDKSVTEVDPRKLRTLSEGLEAHHRAGKKSRTSRKLNAQLEKAIQEAMTELDRMSTETKAQEAKKPSTTTTRLRSAQK